MWPNPAFQRTLRKRPRMAAELYVRPSQGTPFQSPAVWLYPTSITILTCRKLPMKLLTLAFIAAISLCGLSPAHAQANLDGRWRVTFSNEGSDYREAELVLKGEGGNWMTYGRANKDKKDPCIGRQLPVTTTVSSTTEVNLQINASKALEGCKDRTATLRQIDQNTLEGEFENGRPLKLIRN